MHSLVVWQFRDSATGKEQDFLIKILTAFSGRRFAKVLDNIFVVQVSGVEDHKELYERLIQIAKDNPRMIRMVISPPSVGRYRGWLPASTWPDINKIVGGDFDNVE